MSEITTITSKKQLTIPAKIYRAARLKKGEKFTVSLEDGKIILTPSEKIVEDLEGILKNEAPREWRDMAVDQIIQDAKKKYFRHYGKK